MGPPGPANCRRECTHGACWLRTPTMAAPTTIRPSRIGSTPLFKGAKGGLGIGSWIAIRPDWLFQTPLQHQRRRGGVPARRCCLLLALLLPTWPRALHGQQRAVLHPGRAVAAWAVAAWEGACQPDVACLVCGWHLQRRQHDKVRDRRSRLHLGQALWQLLVAAVLMTPLPRCAPSPSPPSTSPSRSSPIP